MMNRTMTQKNSGDWLKYHELDPFQRNLVRVMFLYRSGLEFFRNPTEALHVMSRRKLMVAERDEGAKAWYVAIENTGMTYTVEDHGDYYRVRNSERSQDKHDNWQTIIKVQ